MGFTTAWLTRASGAGHSAAHETTTELWYDANISHWLSIKPDVQGIAHAGGVEGRTAWVGTLRTVISL